MSIPVDEEITWPCYNYHVPGPPPLPALPRSVPRVLDYYDSDDDSWTPDVKERYLNQVNKSQGFDVDEFPFNDRTLIEPLDINEKEAYINFQSAAQMAIKAYHAYKDRKGGELQFVKVVKCMRQHFEYRRYFLTFDARDISNNQVQTYQAVLFRAPKIRLQVQSFRLKPPTCDREEGGAGDHQENWFWRGHVFDPYPFSDDY